ncbi:molybdenum cofactor biosynthesis protein [Phanerochaete sordida]|uniref:Molybdenum cofactor biosynthesis protein n=1 Tax=Phanerochaete sordida TaxID=48140 RepID=A0A9P3G4Q9_9APHY|nr:molybdenum cofactor biosynthesis protein [Phanerochaete sordida]
MVKIRVAVLTVSDTASSDASADKSGPTIKEIVQQNDHECVESRIVPDEEEQIRAAVKGWAEQGVADWIITTGGTGFGVRDRTPEALTPLFEREAPGIVHLLLASSLQKTPFAALSRPVAGTVKNSLVVTLPGSAKAVKENLEALFQAGVINHAIDLIRGGSGQGVHAQLASSTPQSSIQGSQGLQHSHSHHHNPHHHHHGDSHSVPTPRTTLSHDPSAPVSARHRVSPYPAITLEAALESILREVQPLDPREIPVSSDLRGTVLAEDIFAPQNVPPTTTTNVDGYAVRSSDPPGIYKVLTPRTHDLATPVPAGHIFRVNTGAPIPAGTDAVLMVEDTRLHSTDADGEEREVEALAQVDAGESVRKPGSDVKKGELALEKGTVVHAHGGEIGTMAFVGRQKVTVHPKPVVAILSTGNELLDIQTPQKMDVDGWGGIWDTNRPSLQAALEGMGYKVVDLGIVPDSLDKHIEALKRGLDQADIVLTTGGTSMGASDLLKPVIERHLSGTIHFGRVKIKPGKPTTFATIPTAKGSVPMFALPGNPASALVTFHVFVLPALRKLGGWPTARSQLPRVRVQLQSNMPLDPRVEFHRVSIQASAEGLKAYSTGGQRSSRVASLAGANGVVILPSKVEGGPSEMKAGEFVAAIVIGELQVQR